MFLKMAKTPSIKCVLSYGKLWSRKISDSQTFISSLFYEK